jgi:GTP-binding protein
MLRGRRIRLRYAHQGGRNPPLIVVHGTQVEGLPAAYRRYLINRFRAAFDLAGTPLRIELKSGANPFAGRRNKLTPRQERKRKRLKRHVKR